MLPFAEFELCLCESPNILFAFADDWGRQASIYAKIEGSGGLNDLAKTPNFDKLAKSGVLFTNASVNAPSCTPCRSSILSGRNFWETGREQFCRGRSGMRRSRPGLCCCKIPLPLGFYLQGLVTRTPRDAGIEGRPMPFPRPEGNSMDFHSMFRQGSLRESG